MSRKHLVQTGQKEVVFFPPLLLQKMWCPSITKLQGLCSYSDGKKHCARNCPLFFSWFTFLWLSIGYSIISGQLELPGLALER